jgi:putative nucleotidyltransferase with HDIG domain
MYGPAARRFRRTRGGADIICMPLQAGGDAAPGGLRVGCYLPLSLVVTLAVTVLPLFAVSQLGPARSASAIVIHVLAAVALSMLLARVLAALWTRHDRSSDLVFGDLLLWGWLRRALTERRLDAAARELWSTDSATGDRAVLMQRMSALLEARDPYTHGHSRRVARHAERIAREMGLSRQEVAEVRAAALVHDVGKINVPRSILNKPGRLTDQEFALVKRHPGDGAAMVAELGAPQLTAIVRHHHERMDGTGYPDGVASDDIPVGARIIAVADTFDAITSTRPYRKPRTHRQAIAALQREAGTQLDPVAVTAFVDYYGGRRSVGFASVVAAAPQRLLSGLGGVPSGLGAGVAPLAQTACGVGGIALIGACLGGPALPEPARKAEAKPPTAERRLAAQSRAPDDPERLTGQDQAGERSAEPTTTRPVSPRALELPDPQPSGGGGGGSDSGSGGGQTNSGGGGGAGGVGGGLPAPPPVPPVLPDPGALLEPVTDLPLPQVEVSPPQLEAPLSGVP